MCRYGRVVCLWFLWFVSVDAVGAIPDSGIGRVGHDGRVTTEVQVRSVIRRALAGVLVVVAVTACSSDDSSSTGSAPSPSTTPTTTQVSTTSTTDAPTTTNVAVTTSSTSTTTTRPVASTPAFDEPSSWIGVEFETTSEHPFLEGVEILANVDYADLLIDGEPANVYPWYVAETANAFEGPTFYGLIVGDAPHPYKVSEFELEEGAVPAEPVSGDRHRLLIWAISATSPTTYVVTDVLAAELDATLLAQYGMRSILMESYACDLDTSVRHAAPFAFFTESEDLEIEQRYPAAYAFIVYNGTVQEVDGDTIRCVVMFDPDNY